MLIINLGTPAKARTKEVRAYLAEFLDDPRVIDLPNIVRKILLYGFILPFRPKKTAAAYAEIFDPVKGSPLLYHTEALIKSVSQQLGTNYRVVLGMRYGKPSISDAMDELLEAGCQKIVALPLFPQYSSAVNGSAFEALFDYLKKQQTIPSLVTISEFYQFDEFIDLQASMIQNSHSKASDSAIIFSYHSLPVRQIRKSSEGCEESCFQGSPCPNITLANQDCYRAKCFETSRRLAQKLGLSNEQYAVAFQSRLGRTEWIGPDFNTVMKQLIERGIKDLTVSCPSFVVDCLETLEEIGMRGKEEWQRLGGRHYQLTPCLNDDPRWSEVLTKWIENA